MIATNSRHALLLIILAVLLIAFPSALRQTNAAQFQLDVPDPAECTLPTLTEDEVRALIPTPSASPDVILLPTALPTGEPVDEATEAAIRQATHVFYACLNAGTPVEAIGLFSPHFLSQPGSQIEPDFSATVTPLPDAERAAILAIWNMQRLADDRVAATVRVGSAGDEERTRTLIIVFLRSDDRWLIDEFVTEILRDDERVPAADIAGSPPATTPSE